MGYNRLNNRLKCDTPNHIAKTTPSTTPRYKVKYIYTLSNRVRYGTIGKNYGIYTTPQYKNNTPTHTIPDKDKKTYADMVKGIPSTMPRYKDMKNTSKQGTSSQLMQHDMPNHVSNKKIIITSKKNLTNGSRAGKNQ